MKLTSRDLHEELADIYRVYRGVMAPVNANILSLWSQIELLEARESGR